MDRAIILLVDDEEDVLFGLGHVLRGQGYQLRFASGAQAALDLLAAEPVDVVVSDYLMPGLNGLDFLEKVRDRFPDCARLLLTGHDDPSIAIEAINRGLIGRYLRKPCDRLELQVTVHLACEQLFLERENRRLLALIRTHPELVARFEAEHPARG